MSIDLLKKYGVSVAKGFVASTPDEAYNIAKEKFDGDVIVKAQVLAGGRGKGRFDSGLQGGVHICANAEEVRDIASKMINHKIFTVQTGISGRPCNKVFLVERKYIRREIYLAFLLDRETGGPVIIGSSQGGVDIETVAKENPNAIIKIPIEFSVGITNEQVSKVVEALKFRGNQALQASDIIKKLYKLFIEKDVLLLEINPFVELSDGNIICLDAKINFDDNAIFRQTDLVSLRDPTQEDPREVAAHNADLNYIGLDGNIACLVNGAGLAMATMDLIKLNGGSPANFLDVGGGASEQQVTEAFKILTSDKQVKAILVNIFGGIMRCDVIAMGILKAAKTLKIRVPIVVRLQGTNFQKAKEILENSGFRIIPADDLDEAASKVCKVAHIQSLAEDAQLSVSFELPI